MKKAILFFAGIIIFKTQVQGQQIYPRNYFVKETLLHYYSYAFKNDSFHIVLKDTTTSKLGLPETNPPIFILSKEEAFKKILETNNESFHTEDVQLNFRSKDTVEVCVIQRYTEYLRYRGKRNGRRVDEIHVTYPIICFDVDNRFFPVCRFIYNTHTSQWEVIKLRNSLQ